MPAICRSLAACFVMSATLHAEPLSLALRSRGEFAPVQSIREVEWEPARTAIIVCDMWDSHHSVTAVRRVNEMAPRLNAVLQTLRAAGVTVIHSPSDCMPAYGDHPARQRALASPAAKDMPADIGAWCHRIPAEEGAVYPIDQSDGGEDESPWENDAWTERLKADGRNPGTPWLKQNPLLEIDAAADYIAAEGDIVWNILRARGVEHVILSGVHTNMCVLGRPFGLRQMVRAGMDTVLLRDCTDVMYNPERWPYVSHFTGLDLVVEHIERHVCPTISSDQLIGGGAFRFGGDARPTVSVVMPSAEASLRVKEFTRRYLDPAFRVCFEFLDLGEARRGDSEADLYIVTSWTVPLRDQHASKPVVYVNRKDVPDGRSIRSDGGRSANVMGGQWGKEAFERELFEAVCWAADVRLPDELPRDPERRRAEEGWRKPGGAQSEGAKFRDLRTLLRAPCELKQAQRSVRWDGWGGAQVFLNGQPLGPVGEGEWSIGAGALRPGDLNLLVLRVAAGGEREPIEPPPSIVEGESSFQLDGVHWQERYGSDGEPDVQFPIPPQFGAPTDLIQNWGS